MQEVFSSEVAAEKFEIPKTAMPAGLNVVQLTLSHWMGGTLDLDLDVSYDGGESWMYGGGAAGAVSAEPGIEFHFTYQKAPTHIKGSFMSDQKVVSTVKLLAGLAG